MTDTPSTPPSYTAFAGTRRIASGGLAQVASRAKEVVDSGEDAPLLAFDDRTGRLFELDLRGTRDEVLARLPAQEGRVIEEEPSARTGPGRPKLGVVAREVTLLPRHWEWLAGQPGGASVTLRKLVDQARQRSAGRDSQRRAQEVAYRFMQAMVGDAPGFEEATRALFAGDAARFRAHADAWAPDVRDYACRLAEAAFLENENP